MAYNAINIQGNIISSEILDKIRIEDIRFQAPADFNLARNTSVRDEVGIAWTVARTHWQAFQKRKERLKPEDSGTSETRQNWVLPFLHELGYELERATTHVINNKTYAISHKAVNRDDFPVHIIGINQSLDSRAETGGTRLSPHALVQEFINNQEHMFGMVTNGKFLRLMRDATRLSRLSYLEFNLEQIMEEELFSEFALLYRVLHVSRMPADRNSAEESFIEFYHQEGLASGSRIREKLSIAVEQSLKILANGLLNHPSNEELRIQARTETLKPDLFFLYLLRLVYRMLFLLVIEERRLIYPEKTDDDTNKKKNIYYKYYSMGRLSRLAGKKIFIDPRKSDLWQSLKALFLLFENGFYGEKLNIKPLGSGLFSPLALGKIRNAELDNGTLLKVVNLLIGFENENKQRIRVNYADMDVEEFGSVYEGLLEYKPVFYEINGQPEFAFVKGNDRSATGSHYTPEELVKPLLQHSLEHLIGDCINKPEERLGLTGLVHGFTRQQLQEKALLSLKVLDDASGSGHILLSAARRIGLELARVRSNEDQPSPPVIRQATRDAIRNCIYGVDLNPLAVELCKVALWLESHNPGEPLGFLDHHIKCGNSIVGLAHRDELENGIADEAFKTLPGDDKDIAAAFLKKNKQERRIRADKQAGTQMKITDTIDNTVHESMAEYRSFAKLPETTPDEIERKEKAYRKFIDGKGYLFLKTMADTQVAQFFIPKTEENKHRLMTDADYRLILEGQQGWTGQQTAYASSIAAQKYFFHWFLEFPEVFSSPLVGGQEGGMGFDCILGNPPFLGGKKISGNFGNNHLNFLYSYYTEMKGQADFVGYFFRRDFQLISNNGFQSLLSTNTICQGDTRDGSLSKILNEGGQIIFAVKSTKWPGVAALEISIITITKQDWKHSKILNSKPVDYISDYLDNSYNDKPFSLKQEIEIYKGVYPIGKGFIVERNFANQVFSSDQKYENVVMPYINGDVLNGNYDQLPDNYIINFFDWDLSNCKTNYPICFEIVERLVKPERETNNRLTRKENWWKYGEQAHALVQGLKKLESIFAVGLTSKYLSFSKLPTNYVYSQAVAVVLCDEFNYFTFLSSSINNEWAWKYGSTLETRLTYTTVDCFETFPFPQNLSPELEQKLEAIGEAYHKHRRQLMLKMQLGLTKTYNAFHAKEIQDTSIKTQDLETLDKKTIEKKYGKEVWNLWNHLQKTEGVCTFEEAVAGIVELRRLHVEMDNAVLEAYGWHHPSPSGEGQGVRLRHDFYEVDYLPENDRIRYTIHPEARREILKRLLLLNHERYEEEIRQGLHKKADVEKFYTNKGQPVPVGTLYSDVKSKPKKIKKELIQPETVQRNLFDDLIDTTMKEFNLYDGIYSIRDTADIINQPYDKVRRWFLKLSEANYEGLSDSAKTDIDHRRICFHGLVELVVIGEMLEAGVKPKKIFDARKALSSIVGKSYPFATEDVKTKLKVAGNDIIFDHEKGLVTLDGTGQFNLEFIREFFADIEFKSGIAIRLLPAKGQNRIQINPEAAGGRPAFVSQKNVKVETVLRFYKGPESINEIIEDYDISEEDVKAALAYQS